MTEQLKGEMLGIINDESLNSCGKVDKIVMLIRKAGYIPNNELKPPKSIKFEEPRISAEIRQAINDYADLKKSVAKSSHDCAAKIINLIDNEVAARCPECGKTALFKFFIW